LVRDFLSSGLVVFGFEFMLMVWVGICLELGCIWGKVDLGVEVFYEVWFGFYIRVGFG